MKKALVDVPVLLWVFVRPDKIKCVFDVLKEARPSTLFLVSDGPRDSIPTDKARIDASRKVVENIDWDCTVHRLYFDENQGMYPMFRNTCELIFKHVDRCIFLEDDVITSVSFFKYCEELLEKYKDDLRINMICGMNHMGVYEGPNTDYFFTKGASIWGFALWRRTYEAFYDYSYGDDEYIMNRLLDNAKEYKSFCESLRGYYKNGYHNGHIAGFEFFLGLTMFSQNQLNIVPKKNMVCNIGFGEGAAHNNAELKFMSKRIQQFFNMKTYEYEFPLKHPKYVIEDKYYEKTLFRIMGSHGLDVYIYRRVESIIRNLLYGNKKDIMKRLLKKITKIAGMRIIL